MNHNIFFLLFNAKKCTNFEYKQQPKNIYDDYMDYLRERKLDLTDPNLVLEEHHVIPLHKSKIVRNSPEDKDQEKIIVTYDEHYLAHLYHFWVYRLPGDFMFLQLRRTVSADKASLLRQLGGKIAGTLNTPARQNQRRQFLKLHPENLNPSKAGSVGSAAQKEHSRRLGKTYGSQAGISRQNPITKQRISRPMLWFHESGVKVFIQKAETLQQIMTILNTYVPDSVKFTSGLSHIVRKVEKKRYGWVLIDDESSTQSIEDETSS